MSMFPPHLEARRRLSRPSTISARDGSAGDAEPRAALGAVLQSVELIEVVDKIVTLNLRSAIAAAAAGLMTP